MKKTKMKSKLIILLVVLLSLSTMVIGCNSNETATQPTNQKEEVKNDVKSTDNNRPKEGGTIIVGTGADLTKLDLHTSTVLSDRIPLLHVQEMLITIDEQMKIIPMLAESWIVEDDGKKVIFELRKGVKFHNGKELKAEDVKYSIERFMEVAPRKGEFSMVDSINIVSDYTVAFNLKNPSGVFIGSLANPFNPAVIIPKGLAEEQGENITNPIGTGPFKFELWEQGKQLVLKRFNDYSLASGDGTGFGGAKKAYVNEVIFKPISDPSVRITALETGEIDLAIDVLPKDVNYLGSKDNITVAKTPSMNWGMLQLGMNKPPLDNPKMREAVAYAINKQEIVDVATWSLGEVAPSPIFKGTEWFSDSHGNDYKQDIEKAKQLVKEAGYSGEPVVISTSKAYDHHEKTALVLQKQLKEIGLNVEVEVLEWASFISDRWVTGDYNLLNGHITPRPDPNQVYYAYLHSSSSYNGYKSDEMDSLLEKGITIVDQIERKKIYNEVQELLRKDLSFMSLYYYPVIEAHQSYVKGYEAWSAGYPRLWNVWLDK